MLEVRSTDAHDARPPGSGAVPVVQAPVLPRARGRQKLTAGVPLLHGETFDPDWAFCRARFDEVLAGRAEAERELRRAVAGGRLDVGRVLEEALVGHEDHLARLAGWAGVPARSLAELAEQAVGPSLRTVAATLEPLLRGAEGWQRGYCPVCGAAPDLGADGTGAALRCPRCATQWTCAGSAPGGEPAAFRLELAEPEPDEALQDLLEMD